MSHTEKMKKAARISDLELYDLVVAMYPEKFAARDEAGDDLWDEVMQFVEEELCGDLLQDEQGLRELLGRVLLMTHPISSALSGNLYHALGTVQIDGDQVRMMAAAKAELPTFGGLKIVEDSAVPPGKAFIVQDGKPLAELRIVGKDEGR